MDTAEIELIRRGFDGVNAVLAAIDTATEDEQTQWLVHATPELAVALDAQRGLNGDALATLTSRIRNVARLAELGRREELLLYTMSLRESADVAAGRMRSDLAWTGPTLLANAVLLAALGAVGLAVPVEIERVRQIESDARSAILDRLAPHWIAHDGVPWQAAGAFALGRGASLPDVISKTLRLRPPPPPAQAAAEPPRSPAEVVRRSLAGITSVYLAPHIPAGKMRGAGRKMMPLANAGDDPLALIDSTIFGTGADGVLIFDTYLIYTDWLESAERHEYADLKRMNVTAEGQNITAGHITLKVYSDQAARGLIRIIQAGG